LYEYIGGTIRGLGGISLGINGMEDHVHVLAKLRPDNALSDVLRELKAGASGWMHDVFPRLADFSWQRGYAAFTVSQSNLLQVQRYLMNQKEHHQRVSFRDEFIQFLKANEIEFDERYVWWCSGCWSSVDWVIIAASEPSPRMEPAKQAAEYSLGWSEALRAELQDWLRINDW
jgi:putative transposase